MRGRRGSVAPGRAGIDHAHPDGDRQHHGHDGAGQDQAAPQRRAVGGSCASRCACAGPAAPPPPHAAARVSARARRCSASRSASSGSAADARLERGALAPARATRRRAPQARRARQIRLLHGVSSARHHARYLWGLHGIGGKSPHPHKDSFPPPLFPQAVPSGVSGPRRPSACCPRDRGTRAAAGCRRRSG